MKYTKKYQEVRNKKKLLIIPYTLDNTNLKNKKINELVNLEF